MAVLGLAMVGSFSLLLDGDGSGTCSMSPMNRYLWLYAAIYLVGTFFSGESERAACWAVC